MNAINKRLKPFLCCLSGSIFIGGLLISLLLRASPAMGQHFREVTADQMPSEQRVSSEIALGDVDGDGDLDMVVANEGKTSLYLNQRSSGMFLDASIDMPYSDSEIWSPDLALGDVDGDGDLDIVVVNHNQRNNLYLNDGSGKFTDASSRLPYAESPSKGIAFGDLDGDGDLDMVEVKDGERDAILLNNGSGTFNYSQAFPQLQANEDRSQDVALGDVDGDGDLDIVVTAWGCTRLYLNDSRGNLTDVTDTHMHEMEGSSFDSVVLGDLDGDGDLDMVVAASGGAIAYQNDGSGKFSWAPVPLEMSSARGVALGDLNCDANLDIVIANFNEQNDLYINDGLGNFLFHKASTRLPSVIDNISNGVILGDVDRDGDLDIAFANDGRNRLLLNPSPPCPKFVEHDDLGWGKNTGVALGDMDHDGDLDIIISSYGTPGEAFYCINCTGEGRFACFTYFQEQQYSQDIALGDVNRDGWLDVVFANEGRQNRLYLKDGTGGFIDNTDRLPHDTDHTQAVALGDVDGDGDLDMVFANYNEQSRLYINMPGLGIFSDRTRTNMPQGQYKSKDVALGDVDWDGDLDIVFANEGQNRLYLNNGSGTFTDATDRLPTDDEDSRAVALIDHNLDRDLDILFANDGQNRLYINDGSGSGRFHVSSSFLINSVGNSTDIAVGHIDKDSWPDIVITNKGRGVKEGAQNRLYLNKHGGFTDVSGRLPLVNDATLAVALGDVDGDGELDIVVANDDGRCSKVLLNLKRGLFITGFFIYENWRVLIQDLQRAVGGVKARILEFKKIDVEINRISGEFKKTTLEPIQTPMKHKKPVTRVKKEEYKPFPYDIEKVEIIKRLSKQMQVIKNDIPRVVERLNQEVQAVGKNTLTIERQVQKFRSTSSKLRTQDIRDVAEKTEEVRDLLRGVIEELKRQFGDLEESCGKSACYDSCKRRYRVTTQVTAAEGTQLRDLQISQQRVEEDMRRICYQKCEMSGAFCLSGQKSEQYLNLLSNLLKIMHDMTTGNTGNIK